MSPHPAADTIEAHGCGIELRRVEGPEATELFLLGEPDAGLRDAGRQAEAIYRAILGVLEAEGGSPASIVSETVFLRSLREHLEPAREARQRVLAACDGARDRPATTEIEQPPLDERVSVAVSVQAVVPTVSPLRVDRVAARPVCGCADCAGAHGVRIHVGEEARLYASGLFGRGESAYEQTLDMFRVAEELVREAGMTFGDVARTWIHLREMDRDYADLNRARRAFFEARGIDPPPASTGIGGAPAAEHHDLCLGLYAVQAPGGPERSVMTTPTLNEAPQYGSDFARGMRIVESNKVALHVSGTASIDEAGRTVHPEDFDAQVDRMLLNVAGLLEGQGAGFGDVVSAITYLKRPADAARLRAKLREAGYAGFPNALVVAPVCRPDLLCETEALAVLPRAEATGARDA